MSKRKNKGMGKTIVAAFGAVQHQGKALQAVLMATSKKGSISTMLYAILPGQGEAPAFVLVTAVPGVPPQTHGLALGKGAQRSYNGHPRRVAPAVAAQFGLAPAPVRKKADPAAPAAPAK